MPESLIEHITDWRNAVVVERASRTIRNVALSGTASQNGYRYAASALREARPLYENTPVFLDHPASVQRPRDRSARDLAGSVVNDAPNARPRVASSFLCMCSSPLRPSPFCCC